MTQGYPEKKNQKKGSTLPVVMVRGRWRAAQAFI
jgi:hypothetical protein